MDRPGGRLPLVIVKVSTAPLLVSKNASYGWPTAAAGSTQTPLTSVPPLLPDEHNKVICRDWASAGVAAPIPASRTPASSDPVATTAATVFLIMSSSGKWGVVVSSRRSVHGLGGYGVGSEHHGPA